MKKIVALVGIALMLAAGSAMAAGTNLTWGDCGGASTLVVNCTNSALSSPTAHLTFIGAVVPVLGATDDNIVVQTTSAIGSWWGGGTSRFGAALGPSSCPGWYDGTTNGGVLFGPNVTYLTTNRIYVRTVISVATGQEVNVDGLTELLTHTMTIKFASGTFGNAECLAGAAVGCSFMQLQQPGTGLPTNIETADVGNCATFRGGPACPAATPTKKATWGSIKALYR